ncbi:hypothetical protein GCM10018952_73160 [Streptosporangium vulgare]
MGLGDRDADHLDRREPGGERARVVLDQDAEEALDRAEQRRWIMTGCCREPSVDWYPSSKRCGRLKSSWIVDICQVLPIASRAWTEIFGP